MNSNSAPGVKYNNKGRPSFNFGPGGPPYAQNATPAEQNAAMRRTFPEHYLLQNIYEKKTGQSGTPGTGPANKIRAMIGSFKGGRTRKMKRKSKKSRKNRH